MSDLATVPVVLPESPPGVRWTLTEAQVLAVDLSVEKYVELFQTVGRLGDATRFWIGDLLVYGERRFSESHTQVLDAARISEHQADRYRWVAQQVSPVRRRENLSFSHHEVIAALDPADQERLLAAADTARWSVVILRDHVRDLRALVDKTKRYKPKVSTSPVEAVRNLGHARRTLEKIGDGLAIETAEAVGVPAALRAVDDAVKIVRTAAEQNEHSASLLDVARRVVESAVRQRALADPAYIIPAEVFEELQAQVAAHE